jgi:septum site-determining protein MinC
MNSELPVSASIPTLPQSADDGGSAVPQVRFKGEDGRLLLLLPPESDTPSALTWADLWFQFKNRLGAGERFWQPNTPVHLIARDRLLDGRQLQDIIDALADAQLQLKRVYTSRRQTAVAAATAGLSVEQQAPVGQLNLQSSEAIGQAGATSRYSDCFGRCESGQQHHC